jgi:carbon-monoxide dehydrogenase medium subunit
VIPTPFEYERAESVEHAIDLLSRYGTDAKLLAGGHSLLPLTKLREAAPAVLIDIGRLRELAYTREDGDEIAIGALTTHAHLAGDDLLGTQCGLVSRAANRIGDVQVRTRGTIGGSVAHADPAGDLLAALVALEAAVVVRGASGERQVPASEFFVGFRSPDLRSDEMVIEIRVPRLNGWGWHYEKFVNRSPDWAIVGCAAAVQVADGRVSGIRVGLANMGSTPVRVHGVERALLDASLNNDAIAEAAELATGDPPSDRRASASYRRHLARVLTTRAIRAAVESAGAGPKNWRWRGVDNPRFQPPA